MTSTDLRVPVSECRPDPKQPRTHFNKRALKSLGMSIQEVGQRTPIEVRRLPKGDTHRFEIIDGERRWRACQEAGIKTIRICIEERQLEHHEQHLLSVISNFHREDHTHMEISQALQYQYAAAQGDQRKGIVRRLAASMGKTESWVYQYLNLQNLTEELQDKLHPETQESELIRFNEAQVLASLKAEDQPFVYAEMLKLPVHRRLNFLRKRAVELTGKERAPGRPRDVKRHIDRFVARLQADMELVMDLKQADFNRAIGDVPARELRLFRDSLEATAKHLKLLMEATDRSLMVG